MKNLCEALNSTIREYVAFCDLFLSTKFDGDASLMLKDHGVTPPAALARKCICAVDSQC